MAWIASVQLTSVASASVAGDAEPGVYRRARGRLPERAAVTPDAGGDRGGRGRGHPDRAGRERERRAVPGRGAGERARAGGRPPLSRCTSSSAGRSASGRGSWPTLPRSTRRRRRRASSGASSRAVPLGLPAPAPRARARDGAGAGAPRTRVVQPRAPVPPGGVPGAAHALRARPRHRRRAALVRRGPGRPRRRRHRRRAGGHRGRGDGAAGGRGGEEEKRGRRRGRSPWPRLLYASPPLRRVSSTNRSAGRSENRRRPRAK